MHPAIVEAVIVGGCRSISPDVALKWALAPIWREMIRSAAGW